MCDFGGPGPLKDTQVQGLCVHTLPDAIFLCVLHNCESFDKRWGGVRGACAMEIPNTRWQYELPQYSFRNAE